MYRCTSRKTASIFEEELEEALILNSPDKTTDAKMENLILLSLQFYIYRQRLFHNNHLDVLEWAREFRMMLMSEKHICQKENKLKKFNVWEGILEKLS